MLENLHVVDLTQPLDSDTVMWPGAPAPVAETILTIAHDGFYNRKITVVEHAGTHFDAPCHMVEGQASVDRIPAGRLVRPLVVIDIAGRIAGDPDGVLELDDVRAFEQTNGRIPDDAAIFLRTGWEEFNTDAARYANYPNELKFPGFGAEAARFLVDERHAAGLGTDTLGIDPGVATDFVVHRTISHAKGLWHVENLMNLSQVPPLGAWVVVGVVKLVDGSGGPCRVFALVP
ncbi:MAG TPA: cyclase family protein [Candidatus Limnocylindrales bacterium]